MALMYLPPLSDDVHSLVSTRFGVIGVSSRTKTNSRIRGYAVSLIIPKETNPCFGRAFGTTHSTEPFFVAVTLQGGRRTNKRLPRVMTQWGGAVFSISEEGVQWVGLPVNDNEPELKTYLHTEADLREECSSRSVTWSLANQSQSCLQRCYRHFCCSKIGNRSGRFSERQELHSWFVFVHFNNIESLLEEAGS